MYSAREILGTLFIMIFGGPRMARSRARLRIVVRWQTRKQMRHTNDADAAARDAQCMGCQNAVLRLD